MARDLPSPISNSFPQIIDRARKTHLLETFLKESTQLTPELIAQTEDAWRLYIRTKVARGLPESERPAEGQEDATWKRISESITDTAWKAEALKRSEPFDMHATAAVRDTSPASTPSPLILG